MEFKAENVDILIDELNQKTDLSNQPKIIIEEPVIEEAKIDTTPPPVKEEINPLKARGMAARWVKTINSGMKMLFASVYKSTMLKPGDVKAMEEFVRAHKGQSEKEMQDAITNDSPMFDVSNRFDKYLKAVEKIPLDQDEMDSLTEPLEELILKYKNMQLTPEWMFAISVGMIMIPRVAPLWPDVTKIFATKK